jgi:Tfp pilus assembly protein FimT
MSRSSQRGFSLYQGVVVLAIITVTALSSAPLYYRLVNDRHVIAYTNELVGSLHKARHLAISAREPVSLCSSNNGRDCTQTPWSQGYIAFYDAGQPGVVDGDDRILQVVQPQTAPIRVVLNGANHVRFQSNGAVLADAGSSGYRRPAAAQPAQPTALASLLNALSPVSTAHAETLSAAEPVSGDMTQPVAFLVCSGKVGRAIRVTAIGRLDTSKVACR